MKKIKVLVVLLILSMLFISDDVFAETVVNPNILSAHKYQISNDPRMNCITGNEGVCTLPDYIVDVNNTCDVSTIIRYKLSDTMDDVGFYVIKDDGSYLDMIAINYQIGNDTYSNSLTMLESSNFNSELLEKVYPNNLCSYTECSDGYTITLANSPRARLITMSELKSLGCTESDGCPSWLNFSSAYWTFSKSTKDTFIGSSPAKIDAISVTSDGKLATLDAFGPNPATASIRPVIRIKKTVTIQDNESTNESDSDSEKGTISTDNINKNVNQKVEVADTMKTAFIGYLVGSIVLILGVMIIIQSVRKNKEEFY